MTARWSCGRIPGWKVSSYAPTMPKTGLGVNVISPLRGGPVCDHRADRQAQPRGLCYIRPPPRSASAAPTSAPCCAPDNCGGIPTVPANRRKTGCTVDVASGAVIVATSAGQQVLQRRPVWFRKDNFTPLPVVRPPENGIRVTMPRRSARIRARVPASAATIRPGKWCNDAPGLPQRAAFAALLPLLAGTALAGRSAGCRRFRRAHGAAGNHRRPRPVTHRRGCCLACLYAEAGAVDAAWRVLNARGQACTEERRVLRFRWHRAALMKKPCGGGVHRRATPCRRMARWWVGWLTSAGRRSAQGGVLQALAAACERADAAAGPDEDQGRKGVGD